MSTTDVTVAQILDQSASLMNDTAKRVYTYQAQTPYFNMALAMMQEALELNEIPVTMVTSSTIGVTVGSKIIVQGTTNADYPEDLVEINQIWERLLGSSEPFIPMYKRTYIPHYLDDLPVDNLVYWSWLDQKIVTIGATTPREIKLDYIKQGFANTVTDTTTVINVMNSRTFLQFKTAELCSRYIGENPSRADELRNEAEMAKQTMMGIAIKGKQAIQTRRRPFMAGYKMRSTL